MSIRSLLRIARRRCVLCNLTLRCDGTKCSDQGNQERYETSHSLFSVEVPKIMLLQKIGRCVTDLQKIVMEPRHGNLLWRRQRRQAFIVSLQALSGQFCLVTYAAGHFLFCVSIHFIAKLVGKFFEHISRIQASYCDGFSESDGGASLLRLPQQKSSSYSTYGAGDRPKQGRDGVWKFPSERNRESNPCEEAYCAQQQQVCVRVAPHCETLHGFRLPRFWSHNTAQIRPGLQVMRSRPRTSNRNCRSSLSDLMEKQTLVAEKCL